MSKSKIIPVIVEEFTRNGWVHFGTWRGNPSIAALAAYRAKFMESVRPGGCNAHLGPTNTGNLRIRRQRDNAVLAVWHAPVFEVV